MADDLHFTREEQKDIVKEAIHEWLNEKYTAFGKWSLQGIAAGALCLLVYILVTYGWPIK